LPLPDQNSSTSVLSTIRLVLLQEIRSLLLSPALWAMFVIVSILTGYSFMQAVALFSEASKTALEYPELASGMSPLIGIFVPTFGAYYLSQTLLLPFIAIRVIGLDKYDGTLKLLLQLPLSVWQLCTVKLMAMLLVWLISLVPAALALALLRNAGGHIFWPAFFCLLSGHALYSLTVIALAMFAATVSDALPTAAMVCLAVTLGSWVLDFAAGNMNELSYLLGSFSFTAMLRQFESGLLSSTCFFSFFFLAGLFFLLTVVWIHPGKAIQRKIHTSCWLFAGFVALTLLSQRFPLFIDVTENKIHSFSPQYSRALQQLSEPLTITIHLDPHDSRLHDLKNDVLGKLQRTVPHLIINYQEAGESGLFSQESDDKYGLIQYNYNNKNEESYSNSQEEILPIIFDLAEITPEPERIVHTRGYPMVADINQGKALFYLILPLIFSGLAIFFRKRPL